MSTCPGARSLSGGAGGLTRGAESGTFTVGAGGRLALRTGRSVRLGRKRDEDTRFPGRRRRLCCARGVLARGQAWEGRRPLSPRSPLPPAAALSRPEARPAPGSVGARPRSLMRVHLAGAVSRRGGARLVAVLLWLGTRPGPPGPLLGAAPASGAPKLLGPAAPVAAGAWTPAAAGPSRARRPVRTEARQRFPLASASPRPRASLGLPGAARGLVSLSVPPVRGLCGSGVSPAGSLSRSLWTSWLGAGVSPRASCPTPGSFQCLSTSVVYATHFEDTVQVRASVETHPVVLADFLWGGLCLCCLHFDPHFGDPPPRQKQWTNLLCLVWVYFKENPPSAGGFCLAP